MPVTVWELHREQLGHAFEAPQRGRVQEDHLTVHVYVVVGYAVAPNRQSHDGQHEHHGKLEDAVRLEKKKRKMKAVKPLAGVLVVSLEQAVAAPLTPCGMVLCSLPELAVTPTTVALPSLAEASS